ncbi:hypothetical protein FACS189437_01190 [Bacteroidia bacterium]|nr:hypothetical protein FACS189437_01190 [Bacteroidia bacterium]
MAAADYGNSYRRDHYNCHDHDKGNSHNNCNGRRQRHLINPRAGRRASSPSKGEGRVRVLYTK